MVLKASIPTEGLTSGQVESELKRKVYLLVGKAEQRYSDLGLSFERVEIFRDGKANIIFNLDKSEHALGIHEMLAFFWDNI